MGLKEGSDWGVLFKSVAQNSYLHLVQLDLSFNIIKGAAWPVLASRMGDWSLRSLKLRGCFIGAADMATIIASLANHASVLEEMDISFNSRPFQLAALLRLFSRARQLRILRCEGVDGLALEALFEYLIESNVTHLHCGCNEMRVDAAASALRAWLSAASAKLEYLDFGAPEGGSSSAAVQTHVVALAAKRNGAGLVNAAEVHAIGEALTGAHAAAALTVSFAGVARNASAANAAQLWEAWVALIARSIPAVRGIVLSSNSSAAAPQLGAIFDSMLIPALICNTSLLLLDLRSNDLDERAAASLATALRGNRTLSTLLVRGNQQSFGAAALPAIRGALYGNKKLLTTDLDAVAAEFTQNNENANREALQREHQARRTIKSAYAGYRGRGFNTSTKAQGLTDLRAAKKVQREAVKAVAKALKTSADISAALQQNTELARVKEARAREVHAKAVAALERRQQALAQRQHALFVEWDRALHTLQVEHTPAAACMYVCMNV